jgi:predicted amidohydrolase YtcJ
MIKAFIFFIITLVGTFFLMLFHLKAADKPESADLLFLNGKVITVDKNFSIKEAVAVKGGKIIFVGKTAEARAFTGPGTKTIDLQGKTLMPGINDSHTHVDALGSSGPPISIDLNFPNVKSIADIASATSAKAKTSPAGKWIRGFGWNPALLEEFKADPKREPTRWDLDKVSPNNPVIFFDFSHHNAWVNSKALKELKISKDSPAPAGGIFVKDAKGELTGMLRENAAFMAEAAVPPLTKAEMKTSIIAGIKVMNSNGITSYTQPLFIPYESELAIYQELYTKDQLTARVTGMMGFGYDFTELKANLDKWQAPKDIDPNWLQFSQIKIFADGIPPTKTAWMWEPYVGGGYGSLTIKAPTDEAKYETLLQMIRYGHEKGWQIGIHACGDRAISSVLDGYESAQKLFPQQKDMRHYVIHDEIIIDKDIRRSAELHVGGSMQPFIHRLGADGDVALFGPERGPRDWPFKSFVKAGAILTFSSDTPITYPDWRAGVQAAVLREGFSGKVSGPDERISREDAIKAYTINGAWQDHKDLVKGSIEVGKFADFCILDNDILTVPEHNIGNVSVLTTIVGGKIVYEKK